MHLPHRRQVLFAMLYFCEGAPIGFLWWALPPYWYAAGVPVERVATIVAILALPWALKWLWAPLIDVSSPRWSYRNWAITAQVVMGCALVPLPWLSPETMLPALLAAMLVHALAAATQDVAIDAMCVATIAVEERGRTNGWMQAGMLLGRALFGGGALWLISQTSLATGVALLVALLWGAALLLAVWPRKSRDAAPVLPVEPGGSLSDWLAILADRRFWIALAFAFVGGAAFEGVGILLGPYLIASGFTREQVGRFQLGPLAAALAVGALAGGRISDQFGHVRVAWCSLLCMILAACALALAEANAASESRALEQALIVFQWVVVGVFTASSYAMFMDLSAARWKATLFSVFMGATNACEAASGFAAGQLAAAFGFSTAFIMMTVPSLLGLLLLPLLRKRA